jgi:Nucleotidyl transferase AbiEii toxin, Type IV TA system
MNPQDSDRWKSEVLDEIFAALAADEELVNCLVFKGARVLNAILSGGRQSLDLDSNLLQQFVERFPDREAQKNFLERHIKAAITRHFERRQPVKFKLNAINVRPSSSKPHPMGWDAFDIRLKIDDLAKAGVKALPSIQIDVAAPEELLKTSFSELKVGESSAFAYSLSRIAGEKMRAFLSSLPAYRTKIKRPGDAVRAKDLYDLARIQRARPIAESEFWTAAGQEFNIACRSRLIDCSGLNTFTENWNITAQVYTKDPTIPKDIGISEARSSLEEIVQFMIDDGIIPFEHLLPPPPH